MRAVAVSAAVYVTLGEVVSMTAAVNRATVMFVNGVVPANVDDPGSSVTLAGELVSMAVVITATSLVTVLLDVTDI